MITYKKPYVGYSTRPYCAAQVHNNELQCTAN